MTVSRDLVTFSRIDIRQPNLIRAGLHSAESDSVLYFIRSTKSKNYNLKLEIHSRNLSRLQKNFNLIIKGRITGEEKFVGNS